MKTKHLFSILMTAMLLMACGGSKQFKIEGILSPELDGETIYLYDYYKQVAVDSVEVTNGAFLFEGKVDTAYLGFMVSQIGIQFPVIVEPGCDLIVDFNEDGLVQSSPMNDEFNAFMECTNLLMIDYQAVQDSVQQLLYNHTITSEEALAMLAEEEAFVENESKKNVLRLLEEHNNDILGIFAFNSYMDMEPQITELDSVATTMGRVVLENPMIKNTLEAYRVMSATAAGTMFKDFTIEQPDGTSESLSDYVGKGRYVLVDFWASWCGPCRRAIPSIIELYQDYHSKGLDVLGVAVWDKTEESLKTIEVEKMPWPQIINAEKVPTDLYGISGIPHLILFAPDGTIVTRGTAGEDLYATIREVMDNQ